jgi:CheY-like chemotaxis protein
MHGKPSFRLAIFNDSRGVLRLLQSWFEANGHLAVSAALPEMRNPVTEMPRVVLEFRAELIVFDVGIPLLSSWDFLSALQLDSPVKDLPLIVTTRNVATLDRVIDAASGAYEFSGTTENLATLLLLVEKIAAAHRES